MSGVSVTIVIEKETCMIVWEAMVLLRGVMTKILCMLLGSIVSDGCNGSLVPEDGDDEVKTIITSREKYDDVAS